MLQTEYKRGMLKLSDVIDAAPSVITKYSQKSDMIALTSGISHTEDTWCLDQRGLLTLTLTKDTYERLGLVEVKKISPRLSNRHIVQVDLCDSSSKIFAKARHVIQAWDERREQEHIGAWDVLYHTSNPDTPVFSLNASHTTHNVPCQLRLLSDVHIPILSLRPKPQRQGNNTQRENDPDTDALLEDWHADVSALFEWIGMASLGAQRLKANDRVDPYVALYEPPAPSRIGSVTHLRWRGLMPPSFVQSVIDAAVGALGLNATPAAGHATSPSAPALLAITANTFASASVTHIPSAAFGEGASAVTRSKPPTKAVDCWSLIITPSAGDAFDSEAQGVHDNGSPGRGEHVRWIMAVVEI